ncbi:MAG TPA: AI-2E family transporter [Chloroflexota bacterium]|nr:AI-2E family transporter [Chloroflexota bacterium]
MRLELDRTLKVLLTIVLAAVVGYFAWQVIQRVLYPIELFIMGAIVAFVFSPLVNRLHEQGFPRPLAILMVYIGLLGVCSLLGYLLINPLLSQIKGLIEQVPKQVKDLQQYLIKLHVDKFLQQYGLPSTSALASQASTYLTGLGNNIFNNLYTLVLTSFNFLVDLVLILVIAFYLLLDGERLKDRLYYLIPESQIGRVTFVEATVDEVLGGYLRGQLLMSLTIGTMAGAGTAILQVPYPVVIGVLAGILELVPMLGPWLASMPALLIALFSPHPWPMTLWVAIYFLIIQQLESNVIGPRITGHAVGLHPLAALMAVLVGIELYGILGALFAVPVAGILYVLGMAIYYNLTGRERPQPQPRAPRSATSSWLGSLSGKMPRLGATQIGMTSRWTNLRLRRGGDRVVPKRLEMIEQARDALVDRRHQKQADAERLALKRRREEEERRDRAHDRPDGRDHPADATEPSVEEEEPTAARR